MSTDQTILERLNDPEAVSSGDYQGGSSRFRSLPGTGVARSEPPRVPAPAISLSWSAHGATLDNGTGPLRLDESVTLQPSRSSEEVRRWWQLSKHTVYWFHVQVRRTNGPPVALCAKVEDPRPLRGLPHLETVGSEVPLEPLLQTLAAGLGNGAALTHLPLDGEFTSALTADAPRHRPPGRLRTLHVGLVVAFLGAIEAAVLSYSAAMTTLDQYKWPAQQCTVVETHIETSGNREEFRVDFLLSWDAHVPVGWTEGPRFDKGSKAGAYIKESRQPGTKLTCYVDLEAKEPPLLTRPPTMRALIYLLAIFFIIGLAVPLVVLQLRLTGARRAERRAGLPLACSLVRGSTTTKLTYSREGTTGSSVASWVLYSGVSTFSFLFEARALEATPSAAAIFMFATALIVLVLGKKILQNSLSTHELTLGPSELTWRCTAFGQTQRRQLPRDAITHIECQTKKRGESDARPLAHLRVQGLQLMKDYPTASAWWLAEQVGEWAEVKVTKTMIIETIGGSVRAHG